MHRVSALLSWDRRKSAQKEASALSRLSTTSSKISREAFWPAPLDKECEKAARILKSFCTDGYLAPLVDDPPAGETEPKTPIRVTKRIPRRIIQNAAGIAVFTCMRSGLWMTGSGGSGILIARKADGTWSPPSALLLHTPTLSFIIGVDIYDCVLVINNLAALESITQSNVTLGEDVGLVCGPLAPLEVPEVDIRVRDLGNTVFTYLKARGQSQTVNLNGCILTERANENERFYSGNPSVMDVLSGSVARNVEETRPLFEVIKQAEGRVDFDAGLIDQISVQPAPGDAMIESPKPSPVSPQPAFGIPGADDPDPFGVLALEMAGLEIREAGTRHRPTSNQFEFSPSPTSPIFSKVNRQSVDTCTSSSNRGSYMSSRTERTQMTDAHTQTDPGNSPRTTPSPGQSEDGRDRVSFEKVMENDEIDYTQIDLTPLRCLHHSHFVDDSTMTDSGASVYEDPMNADSAASSVDEPITPSSTSADVRDIEDDGGDADDEGDDDEEPIVVEMAATVLPARTAVVTSQAIHAKGALVTIPKRIPPPLPIRSPARVSRSSKSGLGDVSILKSPLQQTFTECPGQAGGAYPTVITTAENAAIIEPPVEKEASPERAAVEAGAVGSILGDTLAPSALIGAEQQDKERNSERVEGAVIARYRLEDQETRAETHMVAPNVMTVL